MKNNIQSIERAFQILRAAYQHAEGVAIGEIVEETGLPTSTASRIVSTLEELNALDRVDGRLFIFHDIDQAASYENHPN